MDIVARLKKDEGFSKFAYRCTGNKVTVGYGRNIDRAGGKGLSEREAHMLLLFDIRECEEDLSNLFGALRWAAILGVRQNALTNMRFQLGHNGFREFNLMIEAIKRKDWSIAAEEALDSRWASQTPLRARRVYDELRTGVDLE